jgi:hypothetical protein
MTRYRIHMINSEFESDGEGDYPSLEAARSAAVSAATKVVAESLLEGDFSVAVEIQIYDGERLMLRNVLNLSLSNLFGGELPA